MVNTEMSKCKFIKAWVGQCNNESVENQDYCEEHLGKLCSCGNQATHNCAETMGAFVCGALLCPSCEENHNRWHTKYSLEFEVEIAKARVKKAEADLEKFVGDHL